jgi:hypothetical protein
MTFLFQTIRQEEVRNVRCGDVGVGNHNPEKYLLNSRRTRFNSRLDFHCLFPYALLMAVRVPIVNAPGGFPPTARKPLS